MRFAKPPESVLGAACHCAPDAYTLSIKKVVSGRPAYNKWGSFGLLRSVSGHGKVPDGGHGKSSLVASEGPRPSLVDAGYCSDSNYDGSSFDGGVGVGIKAGIDFYAGAPTSGFTDSCALVGGVGATFSGSPSHGYAGSSALGLDAGCWMRSEL